MFSLQDVIDELENDKPNVEQAVHTLAEITNKTNVEQSNFNLAYEDFSKNMLKLISTFAISIPKNTDLSRVQSLITTNIDSVNDVLSILSNISRENNQSHTLSSEDFFAILEPVANMSANEAANFSANTYLEDFVLRTGTPLISYFPENYFELQRQDPISKEVLNSIKNLDAEDQDNIIQILRNFNQPNDRESYNVLIDSLLTINAIVKPHQFKKLLKKINQNPDLFLNKTELIDNPFLKLLATLNTKKQVQCLTIFLSRAQQKTTQQGLPDYELADKALIFCQDLLGDISSISNLGLKQKEYIPMLVDTALNAQAIDLSPPTRPDRLANRRTP